MQVANAVATFATVVALDAVKVRRKRVRTPRSRHPGVVLEWRKLPSGARSVRARYVNPDTGRKVWITLDPVVLRTEEARTAWAIAFSHRLAFRREAIRRAGARHFGRVRR